jgi:ABC-type multidrug transport system fused ATPase/permease subunit
LSIYKLYIFACGGAGFWFFLLASQGLLQGVQILQYNWMRIWADQYDGSHRHVDALYYIGVFGAIGILAVVADIFKDYFLFMGGVNSGRTLHQRLLNRVVHAVPKFFETTPVGRILNRFSQDIKSIDQDTIGVINWVMMMIFEAVGVILVVAAIVPGILVGAAVVIVIYVSFIIYYLAASREVKRIEATSKAPLLSIFGETVSGVATIRAFGAQGRFTMENYKRIDDFNRPYYLLWAMNRWLSWKIDSTAFLFTLCAGLLIAFSSTINAGLAGLTLTYALNMNSCMLWIVRGYGMLEIAMNSVERVHEYFNLEQEADQVVETNRPALEVPYLLHQSLLCSGHNMAPSLSQI